MNHSNIIRKQTFTEEDMQTENIFFIGEEAKSVSSNETLSETFLQQEYLSDCEKKLKMEDLSQYLSEADENKQNYIWRKDIHNCFSKMANEKRMPFNDYVLLLKKIGYWKVLKNETSQSYELPLLSKRIEKSIYDEKFKEREGNTKLLVDLCECYLTNYSSDLFQIPNDLLQICVPCLLKAAMLKEQSEEVQKEVDMALLSLGNISERDNIGKELYLNEITEIIQYHQEHQNLSHLAYMFAWRFLINRMLCETSKMHEITSGVNFDTEKSENLESILLNRLNFESESTSELEYLTKCVDWKRVGESQKEPKDLLILKIWLFNFFTFYCFSTTCGKETAELIGSIGRLYRLSKGNHKEITDFCVRLFERMISKGAVSVADLTKGGAIDIILETFLQESKGNQEIILKLSFFGALSDRLTGRSINGRAEKISKMIKSEIFEKLEENGYEDALICWNRNYLKNFYVFPAHENITTFFVIK